MLKLFDDPKKHTGLFKENDNYLIEKSKKLFDTFSIEDFYSEKVQHIYFYGYITPDSVAEFEQGILEALKPDIDDDGVRKKIKPICIHLRSGGGDVMATNTIYSLMKKLTVETCVIIEGYSCSCAIELMMLAPYRVMIDYSTCMIHDISGGFEGKGHETIKHDEWSYYQLLMLHNKELRTKTLLTDEDYKRFQERDLNIDAKFCLKKQLVDRILKYPSIHNVGYYRGNKYIDVPLPMLYKKKHVNHIIIGDNDCSNSTHFVNNNEEEDDSEYDSRDETIKKICMDIDEKYLCSQNELKPVLLHFRGAYNKLFNSPTDTVPLSYRLALLQRKVPVVAFIEGPQSFSDLGLLLMCPIRIMLVPTILSSNFVYNGTDFTGAKTIDILDNTKQYFDENLRFLKHFSQFDDDYYDNIRQRMVMLRPTDMLRYKIIHHCVDFKEEDIKEYEQELVKYLSLDKVHNKMTECETNLTNDIIDLSSGKTRQMKRSLGKNKSKGKNKGKRRVIKRKNKSKSKDDK
jgi:ATP-dependent protease ClpP protease subunit